MGSTMLRFWSLTCVCLLFAAGEVLPVEARDQYQDQIPARTGNETARMPADAIVLAQSDGGLFRSLFGKRKKVKRGGDVRRNVQPQKQRTSTKRRKTTRSTAGSSQSRAPVVASTAKSADAKRVLVIGDFMANALAKGLDEAFAADPDIVVINASNGASGLVRDDYYDWNAKTPELVAGNQANMLVVMVGGNDRQTIRSTGGQIQVNTDAWRTAYDAKVAAFAEMLSAQGVPVVWLSLVPVSSGSLSRDYSSFNSLYRQKAELKGLTFADVWNGFADDKGVYVSSGPDINGQTRQLRAGDGLNFVRAGRRKLAFFVERDIARILSEGQAPIFAGLGEAGTNASGTDAAPSLPAISPMIPIGMISVRPGSGLSTAPEPEAGGSEEGPTEIAAKAEGKIKPIVPPPTGRADDFSWPAPE